MAQVGVATCRGLSEGEKRDGQTEKKRERERERERETETHVVPWGRATDMTSPRAPPPVHAFSVSIYL